MWSGAAAAVCVLRPGGPASLLPLSLALIFLKGHAFASAAQ